MKKELRYGHHEKFILDDRIKANLAYSWKLKLWAPMWVILLEDQQRMHAHFSERERERAPENSNFDVLILCSH